MNSAAHFNEQGWQAELSLGYQRRGSVTVLADRRRRGPLAVQRSFYPEGPVCHSYLLHPPGGVVGGDGLRVDVDLGEGSHALITTPGATKFYRSAGPRARLEQRLKLAGGAALEWLPQESILFPGAEAGLRTRIDIAPDSRFLGWEMQCFGRPVINECFDRGHAELGLELWGGDQPQLFERLRVDGRDGMSAAAGLRGHPVSATLLATPVDSAQLALVREHIAGWQHGFCAATQMDGLLVLRVLGHSTAAAGALMRGVWALLRPSLFGLPPCPPRIWAT